MAPKRPGRDAPRREYTDRLVQSLRTPRPVTGTAGAADTDTAGTGAELPTMASLALLTALEGQRQEKQRADAADLERRE